MDETVYGVSLHVEGLSGERMQQVVEAFSRQMVGFGMEDLYACVAVYDPIQEVVFEDTTIEEEENGA